MHRLLILVTCLFVWSSVLSGQEFIVRDFLENLTDISARENQVMDINSTPCALIKIHTGLENLIFEGNRGIEKSEVRPGSVWIWVPEGTSQLNISREGMPMFSYTLPKELKKSTVYSLKLESDKVFSLIINTGSVSADVSLNDSIYKTNTTISGIPENEYPIRIQKLGYMPVVDTLNVNESNLYFSYTLKRVEQAVFRINSVPTGAVVLIDGEYVGATDFSGFRFPGQYRIQITLNNYSPVDTILTFDPIVKDTFNFNLLRNTGWLNPVINPYDADISIDGYSVLRGITEISAGSGHSISVSKYRYRTINEPFVVQRGDTLNMTITLQLQQGDLSFVIEPPDAELSLKKTLITLEADKEFENKKWTGNSQQILPAGEYNLEAARKGYLSIDTAFSIADEKTKYIAVNLRPKNLNRGTAAVLSTLFPGAGQFYSQRNIVGTAFLVSELVSLGATGYYYYMSEKLAEDYNIKKADYKTTTDIAFIVDKRQAMDDSYQEYEDAAKMRDLCFKISAGIWILNIIDATVFATKYKPILEGKIGKNNSYKIEPVPGANILGASMNILF